jgi:exodeoxyribonuclease VIII
MVDLKTTRDASPRGFMRSIADYRYHVQAAWYLNGVEQATGKRPDQFIFICVESTAPYVVAVYAADEVMTDRGYEQAMKDLGKLAECRAADSWPSYSDQIETISLPGWMTGAIGAQQQLTEIETY